MSTHVQQPGPERGDPPRSREASLPPPAPEPVRTGFFRRAVMYPDRYAWYVLASTLDIMTTVLVLTHLGFREANSFAQKSIDYFGTWGLIGLKFVSVIVVVAICEFVGRQRASLGRTVATLAIVASLFPVLFAIAQILAAWWRGELVVTDGYRPHR